MKVNFYLPLILAAVFCTNLLHAQTNIGGVIASDSVLTLANSPYIVTNNLLIQQGVHVSIEPGVEIRFNTGIYMQVDGELRAIGTSVAPILFNLSPGNPNPSLQTIKLTGLSISYNHQTGTGNRFENCIFTNTSLYAKDCSVGVEFCEFTGFRSGVSTLNGKSYILNCKAHSYAGIAASYNQGGEVSGNEIYDNPLAFNAGASISDAVFINNYIHDIYYGYGVVIGDKAILTNNIISNCRIGLKFYYGQDQIIKCNSFINDSINIVAICERRPTMINNNFFNYRGLNVFSTNGGGSWGSLDCELPQASGTYATFDIGNNYWGGVTSQQMDSSVWDFNDDFSTKILVDYSTVLPDSVDFSTADCSATATGIKENQRQALQIYPNPVTGSDVVFIKGLPENTYGDISIVNTLGEVVKSAAYSGTYVHPVSTQGLNAGMYMVRVTTQQGISSTGKLLIE